MSVSAQQQQQQDASHVAAAQLDLGLVGVKTSHVFQPKRALEPVKENCEERYEDVYR